MTDTTEMIDTWLRPRKELIETLLDEIEAGEIASIETMKSELIGRLKSINENLKLKKQ